MMHSFVGLVCLIFEINGKNWQFLTLCNKNHTKMQSCCVLDAYALYVYAWYFCDHAWALLKTQRVLWICVQVCTSWVYSLFHSALIFEANDGNPLTGKKRRHLVLQLKFVSNVKCNKIKRNESHVGKIQFLFFFFSNNNWLASSENNIWLLDP